MGRPIVLVPLVVAVALATGSAATLLAVAGPAPAPLVPSPEGPIAEVLQGEGARLDAVRLVGDEVLVAARRWDNSSGHSVVVVVALDHHGVPVAAPTTVVDSCPTLRPLAIGPTGEVLTLCGSCATCPDAGPGESLVLRYFDRSGAPLSGEIPLSSVEPQGRIGPLAAQITDAGDTLLFRAEHVELEVPAGDFVDRGAVWGQLLAPLGASVGEVFQVSHNVRDEIDGLDAATSPDGDVIVWWSAFTGESGFGDVVLRRYAATGDALGGVVALADADVNEYGPTVAPLADGSFLASFWRPTSDPPAFEERVVRRVDAAGTTTHEEILAPEGGLAPYAQLLGFSSTALIAVNRHGSFEAQPYSPIDGLLDTRLRVVSTVEPVARGAVTAVDLGDDEHLMVWQEPTRLRARRLTVGCHPSATTLCLRDGRFRVEATWTDFAGHTGSGEAQPLSPESGAFAFFNPAKPDVVAKVLDGRAINGNHWLFWSSLSNVTWELEVTDLAHPAQRVVTNPAAVFGSGARVAAFPLDRDALAGSPTIPVVPAPAPSSFAESGVPGACGTTAASLCLLGGRYEVVATRFAPDGTPNPTFARELTDGGGAFWFFREDNLELFVKLIDGAPVNLSLWAFVGGLTNLPFSLRIRDTTTGAIRRYDSSAGAFASFGDVGALPID